MIKIGLFRRKNKYIKSSNISNNDSNLSKKEKEWYKLESNKFAIDTIQSVFPGFNEDGLKDEIISFLTVYMMYLESKDDKYLSYFSCTDEVKESIQDKVLSSCVRVNFSNVEFRDFAIVGAESKDDSFVITVEVSVFSLDIDSVSIGGKPLSIGVQKVYSVGYTVYKEKYKCCLDCNLVIDGDSCDCGGSNIKELNKKLISKISDKKGE